MARTRPAPPATAARTAPSVSCKSANRQRPAPNAARMDSSCRRALARVNKRFATLAHASSRTSAMALEISRSASRRSPNSSVARGCNPTEVQCACSIGYSAASRSSIVCITTTARAESTPARRRRTVLLSTCKPRSFKAACDAANTSSGCQTAGARNSLGPPKLGYANACGMMPMTVVGTLSTGMAFPNVAGSAPNCSTK